MSAGMVCRDRSCQPERGEDGCAACCVNAGAFDALDFVWVRAWDDCPVIAAMQEESEERAVEQAIEDRHEAQMERMLRAEGRL